MNHNDYIDAGFRVLALQKVTAGVCGCGNTECVALFKHPKARNWQNTPHWSGEQLETMETYGQLSQGFGVLVDDHLIIDIDPRNGGFESYAALSKDLGVDFESESKFVVETGGGGKHIYFSLDPECALVGHLPKYPGIDFKSSGFVVGCGSMHASGLTYEKGKGHPCDVDNNAPQSLIDLLVKKDTYRAEFNGGHIDLTDAELVRMLSYCNNSDEYDQWVQCGMALHHATHGTGFALWDNWSQSSDKYDPEGMEKKWHSFGKSANPVTIGTLIYHAEKNGFQHSVTFNTDIDFAPSAAPIVDLLRPPGFVGKVTEWINSQCRFPRERLAVAAALSAMGNIGGLRYEDEIYGVTSNQFVFCVAGSATGKEAIQQAQSCIHKAAGLAMATHGAIKSEQEIVRNLISNQAALYIIDEMGLVLQKIQNARNRGGAAYLEGVIGMLMSAYSKASGVMLLSGDVREDVRELLGKELAKLRKKQDAGDKGHESKIDSVEKQLISLDNGLERPFLSLIGFTTPVTFNTLVDYEQSANGFFGRSLVVHEKDTNPKAKKRFKAPPLSDALKLSLMSIAGAGSATTDAHRVEYTGDRTKIPTEPAALELLDTLQDELHDYSERAKELSLEAIPRRAFELILKVSLTLAIPERVRTVEHVNWAAAFVRRDIEDKLNLVAGNMASEENRHGEAIMRKIVATLDTEMGETTGVIANRCRPHDKKDIEEALALLESKGKIKSEDGARKSRRWFLIEK